MESEFEVVVDPSAARFTAGLATFAFAVAIVAVIVRDNESFGLVRRLGPTGNLVVAVLAAATGVAAARMALGARTSGGRIVVLESGRLEVQTLWTRARIPTDEISALEVSSKQGKRVLRVHTQSGRVATPILVPNAMSWDEVGHALGTQLGIDVLAA